MALTLTDQDMQELSRLMEDMRGRELVPLSNWLSQKQRAAQVEEMKAKRPEPPELPAKANGKTPLPKLVEKAEPEKPAAGLKG